ncbi:MAG: 2-C-methyl-D-erythritol 4-phosphate cytidylyltransferase [Oscillospiraceae bacterium]|nr:2-C-methyl-D-erythritol 4-phosphate cytidylyltransferase [Oscillospiraceae bacterium]
MPNVTAIIVCAGSSTRMGGTTSKQFIPLCGVPAVVYALKAFEAAQTISEVIVVCKAGDEGVFSSFVQEYSLKKVAAIVQGGQTRAESVNNGIAAASSKCTHFAIHDGARPLIKPDCINNAVECGIKTGAAAVGVKVKDTIKVIDENSTVVATPPRASLVAVQTPQVFEKQLYLNAVAAAASSQTEFTDDCAIAEAFGAKVTITQGDETNIKLTTPTDIVFAEAILRNERGENLK